MSGYPSRSGYPYGGYAPPAQPPPYGSYGGGGAPPAAPYGGYSGGAPPLSAPYGGYGGGAPPPSAPYGGYSGGAPPPAAPYGDYGASAPYGGEKPSKQQQGGGGGYAPSAPPYGGGGYGATPFAALVPSAFPPGTDPNVVACFQAADRDGSGFIDDRELQEALSSYNQSFNIRTVQLLMFLFTSSNARRIGPKEFSSLFYSLQNWRNIFERFDRDRSGRIDGSELREALLSMGFSVSPVVLDMLLSKFDKSGGNIKAIEYDNFIECCLTVKGLTEKFKEKDVGYRGTATFTYESFMLTVLPFLLV